jgi:predicted Zn-dependent peptidase
MPIERRTLGNGLRVVLAPDPTAPSVAVLARYDVGFRSEPEGRTGFAHLFEHLMFEGSTSLDKLQHAQLVQGNGGTFNGHTTPDATVYFEQLPAGALELGLFLEADRMRSVRLSEETMANQIAVVKEEIRVNVLNRPYGGFPWIQLPKVLYQTFNNAHDGYGSFVDLESATIADAASFFSRYYAPGNAVLVVAGDLDVDAAMILVERHFGDIPRGRVPRRPSFAEPAPATEIRAQVHDAAAPLPAVAIGYRVPDPVASLEEYLATLLAIDVLVDGTASRLERRLVQTDGLATHVGGYVGTFGDAFAQRDPVIAQILAYFTGDLDPLLAALDDEVGDLASGVGIDELERVVVANVAAHLRRCDDLLSRAELLAALEQVHGGTGLVAELPERLGAITPDQVAAACARSFSTDRRAVLEVVAGARPGST